MCKKLSYKEAQQYTKRLKEACPQALYICIILIGRSYLYVLPVAYPLYYTSTLSTYLGTLGVLVYQGNSYKIFKAYRDC